MAILLESTAPNSNANVFASAGSGKTWLLITRICRLLLAGAAPQQILAITFTRKSAADMRNRLNQKLQQWAVMPEAELCTELGGIGEQSSAEKIAYARGLYEQLQFSEYPIRISTFHAFCEEVARAFPLESELPSMFELSEYTHVYANQAFQHLLQQSEQANADELRHALHTLYDFCFGFVGAKNALLRFLDCRTEWRVYTQTSKHPATFAAETLAATLEDIASDPELPNNFFKSLCAQLRRYREALALSTNASHQKFGEKIDTFFKLDPSEKELPVNTIKEVFITTTHEMRKLKPSKKWQSTLGATQTQQLLQDHQNIYDSICAVLDQSIHARFLAANQAWFYAGNELLKLFQRVKFEHGIADFNDLEWETFRLLQQEDQALWIQYKLGAKIQHFLVDEFQDTNPIQWQLLKPLIESSSEQHQNESSSLFLVGDVKQSIYRFRGANPEIQTVAANWSQQEIQSQEYNNNTSWRSAPAIIECINKIFSSDRLNNSITGFQTHVCQHAQRWGRVEIHPLIAPKAPNDAIEFRNPLTQSSSDNEITAHYQEGVFIGQHIHQLMDAQIPVYENDTMRPLQYNDILILTRTRSHLDELKAGLRHHHVPIQTSEADHLLDYLEVQDMLALLTILADPLDDKALVQVLRSPVFAISNRQLVELQRKPPVSWNEKLSAYSKNNDPLHPLVIAHQKLHEWRAQADRVPVHDLLSHIYANWSIPARYTAAVPTTQSTQVRARLHQLLHLSLEIDSGRYSSIFRLLRKLRELNPDVTIDEQSAEANGVRLMTVHGAKGLESPVVYVADCGPLQAPPDQYKALSLWPASAQTPTVQMLASKKAAMSKSALELKEQIQRAGDENLNLMYVALTRAKQVLIVTGVHSSRNTQASWHQLMCNALDHDADQLWELEPVAKPAYLPTDLPISTPNQRDFDLQCLLPIHPQLESKSTPQLVPTASAAAQRGTIIHKCLEILSVSPHIGDQALCNRIALETNLIIAASDISPFRNEAEHCLRHHDTMPVFKLGRDQIAFNELAIASDQQQAEQFYVIDRLILANKFAWIIDYKTDTDINANDIHQRANTYKLQLKRYAQAVEKLYPDREVRCSLLFTKQPILIDIDVRM